MSEERGLMTDNDEGAEVGDLLPAQSSRRFLAPRRLVGLASMLGVVVCGLAAWLVFAPTSRSDVQLPTIEERCRIDVSHIDWSGDPVEVLEARRVAQAGCQEFAQSHQAMVLFQLVVTKLVAPEFSIGQTKAADPAGRVSDLRANRADLLASVELGTAGKSCSSKAEGGLAVATYDFRPGTPPSVLDSPRRLYESDGDQPARPIDRGWIVESPSEDDACVLAVARSGNRLVFVAATSGAVATALAESVVLE